MEIGERILLGQFYRELKLVNGEIFIQPCFWMNVPKPELEVCDTSKIMFSIYKAKVIHTNKSPRKMAVTTTRTVLEDGELSTEGFVNYNYIIAPDSARFNQLANLEWSSCTFTKAGAYKFNFQKDVYFNILQLQSLNRLLDNRLTEIEMTLLMADIAEHLSTLEY